MNKLKVTTLAAALMAASSFAQAESHGMIGLTVIAPKDGQNTFGGYITAYRDSSKFSFYGDGYYSGFDKDQTTHYETLGPGAFGDPEVKRDYYYTLLHLGATYRISDHWHFYSAFGVAWKQEIITQYDPMYILSRNGNYTIEGEQQSAFSNSTGVLFTAGKLNLKAGYISSVKLTALGIGYTF